MSYAYMHECGVFTYMYLYIYLHPLNKEKNSALSIMSFSIHASSSCSFVLQLMNRDLLFFLPSLVEINDTRAQGWRMFFI